MDFESAKNLAMESFLKLHPRESLPKWVNGCATAGGFHDPDGSWVIELTLNQKVELKKGEHWEIRNGRKVVVVVDPKTGQKKIVIHRSGGSQIVIFRAIVSTVSKNVFVALDSDLSKMDGNLYERIS